MHLDTLENITMNFRMDLVQNVKRADNAEKEIGDLSKKIKTLLAEKPKSESEEVPEELLQLRLENTNLKSELQFLQSTTAEIQSQKTTVKPEKARLFFCLFFFFNNSTKYDTLKQDGFYLHLLEFTFIYQFYGTTNTSRSSFDLRRMTGLL